MFPRLFHSSARRDLGKGSVVTLNVRNIKAMKEVIVSIIFNIDSQGKHTLIILAKLS